MPFLNTIGEWPKGLVPQRIVSLVPSITELLFDLGLDNSVVGITKFCTHPHKWFTSKKRIGGTKNVKVMEVLALQPDLVIANREENVAEQVYELAKITRVWLTEICTLEDALKMIQEVGIITGCDTKAKEISDAIEVGFNSLPAFYPALSATYLIWNNPAMVAGGDTFIHHMMEKAGLKNQFGHTRRYPELDIQSLKNHPPDLLLLSSEPFPFGQRHVAQWQEILPETKIELVDGSYFSWYGSRLVRASGYFAKCMGEWNQTS